MSKANQRLEEIRQQIVTLEAEAEKIKLKSRKAKGELKPNEWAKVRLYEYDCNDDGDALVEIDSVPLVIYNSTPGVVALNGYFDIPSPYIKDIEDYLRFSCGCVNARVEKITPEEAIFLLNQEYKK